MFALREGGLLEEGSWPFHLPRMRVRGFSAGRHVVSGHPQTAPLMVSGDSENAIGRIRLSVLENAAGETLAKAVQAAVEPGSLVRSDGLAGYSFLPDYGYIHVPSFHKEATPGDATPLAHRVASLLKRWWLGTHQGAIRPDHLAYYLDEFTFRFKRRTSRSRGKLFYRLIEGALQTDPVPAKTLAQHLEGRESTA